MCVCVCVCDPVSPPPLPPQTAATQSQAVVPSAGTAVATRANSGVVSGIANVGIRRAEIKQGGSAEGKRYM